MHGETLSPLAGDERYSTEMNLLFASPARVQLQVSKPFGHASRHSSAQQTSGKRVRQKGCWGVLTSISPLPC